MEPFLVPRIEDAGLEDCALPPEAINEAFAKAAEFFNSRSAPDFNEDDDDPGYLIDNGIDQKHDFSPEEVKQEKGTELIITSEEPSSDEIPIKAGENNGAESSNDRDDSPRVS